MPRLQFPRTKSIVFGLLSTAIITIVYPPSANAQIFGGRVRNWFRGDSTRQERERIPLDGPVIIERRYVEPRIVIPGEPEAAVQVRPRYRTDDYGDGVSERGLRESRFSIRRRAASSDDTYEYPTEQRTVRELDRRRSVLRAPEDRWQQDDVVVERRSRDVDADYDTGERRETARVRVDERDVDAELDRDVDRDAELSADAAPRRGERTVRIDRFENGSRVSPAEDRYEQAETTRDLELRDARGREEDLVDDLPPRERDRPRTDERVRPAAAEASDAHELPKAVDRPRPEAIDDFDRPRAARDAADAKDEERASSETRRLTLQPPQRPAEQRRPQAADDEELLPPPPTDE